MGDPTGPSNPPQGPDPPGGSPWELPPDPSIVTPQLALFEGMAAGSRLGRCQPPRGLKASPQGIPPGVRGLMGDPTTTRRIPRGAPSPSRPPHPTPPKPLCSRRSATPAMGPPGSSLPISSSSRCPWLCEYQFPYFLFLKNLIQTIYTNKMHQNLRRLAVSERCSGMCGRFQSRPDLTAAALRMHYMSGQASWQGCCSAGTEL